MDGYGRIAHLMTRHPEFAIVRRFGKLSCQDLLYLQAEIIYLEAELAQLSERDRNHHDRRDFAHDWWSLAHAQGGEAKERWKKTLKMRSLLRQYSK